MAQDFYDKVAKKFGNYDNPAKYTQEFNDGKPEKIFKEKLLKLSGKEKTVLDSGCGDGRFTLEISPYFNNVIGNDISKLMLRAALKLQKEKGIKNVVFLEKSTNDLDYPRNSFDVIYARRAETNYPLFYKMLKPGGHVLYVGIGEKDCQEIKEVFGRGQGYGKWNSSRLKKDKQELKKAGFEAIFAQDYYYNEYYVSYKDLDLFLQGVPIFEDFDSKKDRAHLSKYVDRFVSKKGIRFPRHRIVIIAQKI